VNSSFYSYFHTLTSTQFTSGIKALLSEDMEKTPIVDMNVAFGHGLTNVKEVENLFDKLHSPTPGLQKDIDTWVSKVAGFDTSDQALIFDTLSVAYPIGEARNSGKFWVPQTQFNSYVSALRDELRQLDADVDTASLAPLETGEALRGWRFVRWKSNQRVKVSATNTSGEDITLARIDAQTLEAVVREKYPQGEIWAMTPDGEFVFGQLALKRLWLPSRAILAAQVIIAWADQHRT
jgi:hypothetical protein